jgi:serine phosphatase RsbU (regulator of sigma subunit)
MLKMPKYYIFRILTLAVVFYFMLILPPFLFVLLKTLPNAFQSYVVEKMEILEMDFSFNYLLFGLILYILVNYPFRILFYRKKRNKSIAPWLQTYTKKTLRLTPIINALLLFIPEFLSNIRALKQAYQISKINPEVWNTSLELSLVSFVSSILVGFMIYLWQENRVRIHYLPIVFSLEDLKHRYKKVGTRKINTNFIFSGLLTSMLPIVIIIFYLVLSATPVNRIAEKNNNQLTPEQAEILFGGYYHFFLGVAEESQSKDLLEEDMITRQKVLGEISELNKNLTFFYYNASDSFFMTLGILNSILIALFYIVLVNKFNARVVVVPLTELMRNMQKTANGEFGIFNLVRTNNEIGSLAESFNVMSEKLNLYFKEITDLNKSLEQKVIERTAFIEQQKEEILSQRDEIEAQRDNLAAKNEEIEAQHDQVVAQRDKISDQHRQITDSINYAKTIQNAILPPTEILDKIIPDRMLFFKPKDIVSGDFYWAFESEDETKSIIAVADCTGHGVPGALMSMLGISILNEIAVLNKYHTASEILENLRFEIIKSMNPKGAKIETKDGMDMSLCLIDRESRELHFAGANNPLYYFREKELHIIKGTRSPIGVYKSQREFENIKMNYMPDDIFYLFSDGYRDQMSPQGERLKTKGFVELLNRIAYLKFDEQHNKLALIFENWKLNASQTDDILVLGFKIAD